MVTVKKNVQEGVYDEELDNKRKTKGFKESN